MLYVPADLLHFITFRLCGFVMASAPTSSIAEGAEHTVSVAPAHCPIILVQIPIEACLRRVFGTLCCMFGDNVLARRACLWQP